MFACCFVIAPIFLFVWIAIMLLFIFFILFYGSILLLIGQFIMRVMDVLKRDHCLYLEGSFTSYFT